MKSSGSFSFHSVYPIIHLNPVRIPVISTVENGML